MTTELLVTKAGRRRCCGIVLRLLAGLCWPSFFRARLAVAAAYLQQGTAPTADPVAAVRAQRGGPCPFRRKKLGENLLC